MTKIADGLVRVLAAVALGVSAYVHLHLSSTYAHVPSHVVNQGTAFKVQGVLAIVLAVLVVVAPVYRRTIWTAAGLLMLASVAAVLITRYTNVEWIPGVYPDRTWQPSPDKVESMVAEMIGVVLAIAGIGLGARGLALHRRVAQAA